VSKEFIEYNRKVDVRYRVDIAVLGGGLAGICAACAAAKMGKKVLLVEKMNCLGGNSTSGGVASFCGETKGQGEIFDEIIRRLDDFGAIAEYKPYPEYSQELKLSDNHEELFEQTKPRIFDFQFLVAVFDKMVASYNIDCLFHTKVVDTIVDNKEVKQVLLAGPSGLEACSAEIFIDCTGEGDVAYHGGFETMKGREGDHAQLPMSLMFFIRNLKNSENIKNIPEEYVDRLEKEEDLPMNTVWPNGPLSNAIKVKVIGFDSTDTVSLTQAEFEGRRKMLQVIDYRQRVEGNHWFFDHISPIIGIREGRRAVGDYILSVEDLRSERKFDDSIAKGVYFLDAQSPVSEKRVMMMKMEDTQIPPYQIPFRSLLVKNSVNLLVAGRCFSADQLTMSSARVFTTTSMTGQAAGVAAALALTNGCKLREIDIKELQSELIAKKAVLS
jgi:hypothetical protein